MELSLFLNFSINTTFALRACAVGVVGSPEGFGTGTTGGGSATPVYPSTTAQLQSYLEDDVARVIVLNKEFNFKGTTTTATGCRPTSNTCPGNGGQDAINANGWCGSAPAVSVTYDTAAITPINLGSNKSLIGIGTSGVIRGKGLRIANGAKNVIIQNIHITELNPQYIWGGDAITLDGADLVWVDHVKISLIGRQMFVAGYGASNRVTISNTEFDGSTSWSATCDGHHYWTILLLGSSDLITLKGNYIHHTSGRGPKIGGNTLLHAVNNEWYAVSGHAFDLGESGAMAVAEGNVFQNVVTPLLSPVEGRIFTAPSTSANTACATYMGRNCVVNAFGSSGTFSGTDTSFFSNFQGKTIASAAAAAYKDSTAGIGKI
ncbi:Pectate lyase/Amb allergen [Neofusicoccum parvum]|uniref:Pectate lyase/Amb allergen n=1 Tax=Neofusicoccum parvum TaxID=310453 RepID=A0ACB5RN30_9PEZI|nr:Pectate lyase/Amb allergen [Neofusicoccum parvum]GME33827.1 Pectate lyase/Amb allergen [Neofusicoccum parvum]